MSRTDGAPVFVHETFRLLLRYEMPHGHIHAAVEAMDIAESWREEAYRSMRADMQAMYGCSRGMIAEQLVGAAAARISFLLKLDKKGAKSA